MGWFSKAKKKLKKLKLSKIAKAVKKAGKSIAKAGNFLPAPIGTVAKGLGALADKIPSIKDKKKKKTKATSSGATSGSLMSKINANPEAKRMLKSIKSDVKQIKKIVQ